ncbi:hypothetical protein FJR48_11000 [Sulfurimonas lithotrophica]|uniref:Uncharacterized protein n=1 Tax=Sulfurimonas lithotrophica TaxID=2590022 RepID=A0A5P8P3P9_9BACT|nr:hypothetical protein [Sulfurimonas lithotrophica]QFR50227.1 hypothetical protein FJR48_11000 [Sulfurimonas lithotrophica]
MLERIFTIDAYNEELEIFDNLDDECAQSICENNLEIPKEYINKISCKNDSFTIYLANSRSYYRDDWYVNLQRLEYVS